MKTSVILSLLLAVIVSLSSTAQNWQNITRKKGGYASSRIVNDSKGNLYVFTPAGVFTSLNNGVNWKKLGKNIFKSIRPLARITYPLSGATLLVSKDTVNLFFNSVTSGFTSVYYDKGSDSWKGTGVKINDYSFSGIVTQAPKRAAFFSSQNPRTINYSDDGKLVSWKSILLSSSSIYSVSYQPLPLDNKFYVIGSNDTVYILDANETIRKRKMDVATKKQLNYEKLDIVNNQIVQYGFNSNGDSLIAQRLDTSSLRWLHLGRSKYKSKKGQFSLSTTASGYLYDFDASEVCISGVKRSKDWGNTWETVNIKIDDLNDNLYSPPFYELGGKTYLSYYKLKIQNTSSLSSTQFDFTAPEDFGFQNERDEYFYNMVSTKNYVGDFMRARLCPDGPFYEKTRWDGTWKKVDFTFQTVNPPYIYYPYFTQNFALSTFRLGVPYPNGRVAYYISNNEGATWDSLPNPNPKKNEMSLTEIKNVFFAAFPTKVSDSLFVSTDFGKNWQIKKLPTVGFANVQGFKAIVDYHGDDLYYFASTSTVKKAFVSSTQGTSWEDVTYNIPQNLPFRQGYATYLYRNFKQPTLYLGDYYYNYSLDKANKTWTLVDSTHDYSTAGTYRMDTTMRISDLDPLAKETSKAYLTEISFNGTDWRSLNSSLAALEQGDTLLFFETDYNAKGIYAKTNYGIFFMPYSGLATSLYDLERAETKDNYTLYPNPSSSTVQILPAGETVALQLLNLQGQTVLLQPIWDTEKPLDLSSLIEGVYFLKIKGKQEKVIKLVKR